MKRECDSCGVPHGDENGRWLVLVGGDIAPLGAPSLGVISGLQFCSWDCVADFARLRSYAEQS